MTTDEQLAEVERLGGLMFDTSQVVLIMGLDMKVDTIQFSEEFRAALDRGRLRKEAQVRTSVFELAVAGSAPAQALAKQFIDQARVAAAGL